MGMQRENQNWQDRRMENWDRRLWTDADNRSLVPGRVSPSSEELDPDEPTRSPLPRLLVRDTEVISDR